MSRLEWAFAGKSYTKQSKIAGGPAHTVWCHGIDSQNLEMERDEGDMYEQEDGDILECGETVDAQTGEVKKYEELWHDVGLHLVGQETEHLSIMLKTENKDLNARGMILRVGNWCQGILKVGEDTTVERWQWSPQDGWERLAKLGQKSLVCPATFDRGSLQMGKVIKDHDLDWQVFEFYSWK